MFNSSAGVYVGRRCAHYAPKFLLIIPQTASFVLVLKKILKKIIAENWPSLFQNMDSKLNNRSISDEIFPYFPKKSSLQKYFDILGESIEN